jgi:hypothetical protein
MVEITQKKRGKFLTALVAIEFFFVVTALFVTSTSLVPSLAFNIIGFVGLLLQLVALLGVLWWKRLGVYLFFLLQVAFLIKSVVLDFDRATDPVILRAFLVGDIFMILFLLLWVFAIWRKWSFFSK